MKKCVLKQGKREKRYNIVGVRTNEKPKENKMKANEMKNVILVNGKNPDMGKVEEATKKYGTTEILFTEVARTKASKLVGDRNWHFYFPRSIKRCNIAVAMQKAGMNVVATVDDQLVEKGKRAKRAPVEQKWIEDGYKKEQASWVNKESDCENGHISVEEHQKIERYFARLLGYKSGKLPWYVAAKLSESEILWQEEMGMRNSLEGLSQSRLNKWKTTPDYWV